MVNYTKKNTQADLAQSAQNEKIRQIYELQIEICRRDKHLFSTPDFDTMLQSRSNKKRPFLECAVYLKAASRKNGCYRTTNNNTTF